MVLDSFDKGSPSQLCQYALFSFLFYTGCRISEALGTRVKDIEEVDKVKVIHIHGKGSKIRAIPIHPKLNRALKELIGRRGLGKDDFLFTSVEENGKTPLTRTYVNVFLRNALV